MSPFENHVAQIPSKYTTQPKLVAIIIDEGKKGLELQKKFIFLIFNYCA